MSQPVGLNDRAHMDSPTSRFKPWRGTLLLVPSLFMWVVWISSFNAGTNQVDRKAIFLSHFPDGIPLSLFSGVALLTSLAAVVFGGLALRHSTLFLRLVNIAVIVLGCLLSLLNVFQSM
jgi:hypothetical protein